jgi:hypothetical protein
MEVSLHSLGRWVYWSILLSFSTIDVRKSGTIICNCSVMYREENNNEEKIKTEIK